MKSKLDEMTREAQSKSERAQELRSRLEETTAMVDGLVDEARSTLRRAVEFLEREGFRGKRSAPPQAGAPEPEARSPDSKRRASRDAVSGKPKAKSPRRE